MKRPHWPKDPRRYRWLVDGHNAIFAHPTLEALQTGEEKAEARRMLESMLDRFAAARGLRVTIVYDGNESTQNPDAGTRGWIVSQYSLRPNEDADDRIVWLASESVRTGRKVVVVTSDRALGARLPSGVSTVEPAELFRRLEAPAPRDETGPPPGDYSDIEAHFLSLEPRAKPRRPKRPAPTISPPSGLRSRSPAGRRSPSTPARPKPPPTAVPDRDPDAVARKKARGRRKQERRLARAKKPKRRPGGR